MQEVKREVFIDPFTDFGAKKLFASENSSESIIDFLNSILKLEQPIVEIEFITNEQLGALKDDRKAVFDIHCKDDDGNYLIIEIQQVRQSFFKDRSIFYSTYPVRAQAQPGDWDFALKKTYTICILNFCFDDTHPDQMVHRVKLIEEDTHTVFCDRLMYWYIEMPKFKMTESELVTREHKWLYVLKNLVQLSDIPLILADDPIFKRFFMDAKTANLMERELSVYYAERKAEWDKYAELKTAKEDGKLEGIEIATKERNTAFATYMLQYTDQTVEQIATAIDVPLSFVQEIKDGL